MAPIRTVHDLRQAYADEPGRHRLIFDQLCNQWQDNPEMVALRRFVEQNRFGFGERAFYPMWDMLIAECPTSFSFLEIGVFRGQTLAVVGVCAKQQGKDVAAVGVTPLDERDGYAPSNYRDDINTLLSQHAPHLTPIIIPLSSTEPSAVIEAGSHGPYDLVYIDGGHDYNTVVSDIRNYREFVRRGGFLVMDDSSSFLRLPPGMFPGIVDVSRAVRDELETDSRFEHVAAVGHNRIWQRIS